MCVMRVAVGWWWVADADGSVKRVIFQNTPLTAHVVQLMILTLPFCVADTP